MFLGTVPEAQQPPAPVRPAEQPIFVSSVSLVQLDAVVTDKQGAAVTTLGPTISRSTRTERLHGRDSVGFASHVKATMQFRLGDSTD